METADQNPSSFKMDHEHTDSESQEVGETGGNENESKNFDKSTLYLFIGSIATSLLSGIFVLYWGLTSSAEELKNVAIYSFTKLGIITFIRLINFLLGYYVVLPKYVGMEPKDVYEFYLPKPIALTKWMEKYDEKKFRVRDALQRKIPHFLHLSVYILLGDLLIGTDPSAAGELIMVFSLFTQLVISVWLMASLFLYRYFGPNVWYGISAWNFAGAWRIRDGTLRCGNVFAVTITTQWASAMMCLYYWLVLTKLSDPSEAKLMFQMFTIPIAVGDALAEIVGSIFGKRYFKVTGMGAINKKTVEGVVAMFLSTLVSLIVAVVLRQDEIGSLQEWILVSVVVGFTSTLAETYSPRSIDNFTIPFTTCIVMHIYLLIRGGQ